MKFSQPKENQRHIPTQIKHKHHSAIPQKKKKIPFFRTQTQKDPTFQNQTQRRDQVMRLINVCFRKGLVLLTTKKKKKGLVFD